MKCLLIYDIPDDRVRSKIADFCLDYGLDRVQYSAFVGDLSRNHQEELLLKIGKRLGKAAGRIDLFAICKEDWNRRQSICQGMDESHPPAGPRAGSLSDRTGFGPKAQHNGESNTELDQAAPTNPETELPPW